MRKILISCGRRYPINICQHCKFNAIYPESYISDLKIWTGCDLLHKWRYPYMSPKKYKKYCNTFCTPLEDIENILYNIFKHTINVQYTILELKTDDCIDCPYHQKDPIIRDDICMIFNRHIKIAKKLCKKAEI